ncbi:hypothetical protein [Arthrobacter sp. HLT1-21]
MASNRRQQRKAENLDILIGFLGFFVVALVVVIVAMEISGRNAALWSVALFAVLLSMWGLFRVRRRDSQKRAGE